MSIGTFIAILVAFFVGYFLREITMEEDQKIETDNKEEIERQKEKYEKIRRSFDELMDYDYETALRNDRK